MEAHVIEVDGKQYAFYPALKKRMPFGKGHPEEAVRRAAYNALISTYNYPPEQITIEQPVMIREDESPRFADIVVFADRALKRPLIVVEAKKPNREDGERQGQRYAAILRAVYIWWTNGADNSFFVLKDRYPDEAAKINQLPDFGGSVSYRITSLKPFSDDNQISSIIRKCHNDIRNTDNKNPQDAFVEFSKILLAKFYDERSEDGFEMQVGLEGSPPKEESPDVTAQRTRSLFHEIVLREAGRGMPFLPDEDIALSNEALTKIIKRIQSFSFNQTETDAKARALETFLSNDLRQEFKEFMTPRRVVEAVIEMISPKHSDRILDPCCGTGAFLIYALKHIRAKLEGSNLPIAQQVRLLFDFAHDRLWGADVQGHMTRISTLQMISNDDGRTNLFQFDSLRPRSDAPEPLRTKSFDYVLTNPPFGTSVSGSRLKWFDLTSLNETSKKQDYPTELLYIERNLQYLSDSGELWIVLPDSVLTNLGLKAERAFIEQQAQLKAVISLPADTFGPSGAKSKTSVVVFKKYQSDVEHDVFVANVHSVGYNFVGAETPESPSQLPEVVRCYRAWEASEPFESDICKTVSRPILKDRWSVSLAFSDASDLASVRLGDICTLIDTGKTPSKAEYRSAGHPVIKVGNLSGNGIRIGNVERQYVDDEYLAKKPKFTLEDGDIIFTATAHGPKWIGLKVDMFMSDALGVDQNAVACGEVLVLRLAESAEISPHYLLMFLRSGAGYQALQKCIRGQSGHIYKQDVAEIMIPSPSNFEEGDIRQAIESLVKVSDLNSEIRAATSNAESWQHHFFPGPKKPIIAS